MLALFIAIVVIQNIIPFLGYIPIGPFSIVIIQVTVVVAAIMLGPADGAWVGLTWGLINWIRAFVWPTSPLAIYVLVNPLVSVLPRVAVGLISGYFLLSLVNDPRHAKIWQLSLTGIVGSVINTVLVLGFMGILYYLGWLPLNKLNVHAVMPWLLGIMGTNGVPEAVLSGVLVPLISKPLLRFVK
ncbi:ECF transporter S component [Secundilactobacillus folii]|uniref:ECF transporter S component n=1 Tax=Secundilactobacillus folii TaxID=2678357 RepID=UPI0031B56BF7